MSQEPAPFTRGPLRSTVQGYPTRVSGNTGNTTATDFDGRMSNMNRTGRHSTISTHKEAEAKAIYESQPIIKGNTPLSIQN